MDLAALETTLGWARDEGWNPGLDDAGAFLAADPDGFLVGMVDGEQVSSISLVRYADFAFLGLYVVRPDRRGRGHGLALWEHALSALPDHVVVGLDGVVSEQDNYRRSGFALAHRNARWGGTVSALPVGTGVTDRVRALGPGDVAAVAAYDVGVFPAPREAFLAAWLTGATTRRAMGWFEHDRLGGWGCVRACHEGWKVGPLFADSPDVAEALVAALLAPVAPGPVFLDVPEPNAAAVALATSLGLSPAFETARMYRGDAPDLDLDRIFGITTLELG